jgi:hypothetical protein
MEGTNNDGLADSLSLVLGSGGNVGPAITGPVISAGAYGAFDSVTTGTWMEIYGENLARVRPNGVVRISTGSTPPHRWTELR